MLLISSSSNEDVTENKIRVDYNKDNVPSYYRLDILVHSSAFKEDLLLMHKVLTVLQRRKIIISCMLNFDQRYETRCSVCDGLWQLI